MHKIFIGRYITDFSTTKAHTTNDADPRCDNPGNSRNENDWIVSSVVKMIKLEPKRKRLETTH